MRARLTVIDSRVVSVTQEADWWVGDADGVQGGAFCGRIRHGVRTSGW